MISNDSCSVLVHVPAPLEGPRQPALNLWPGEASSFGRGSDTFRVDIRIDRPGISRVAGRIEVVDSYWLLTNLSSRTTATYVVHNDEGRGEHFTIRPGERLPVPFASSRVELLSAEGEVVDFKVFAMRRPLATIPEVTVTGRTADPIRPLDPTTKHFLVLVALCEPRLVYGSAAIPTIPGLLRTLRRTATGQDLATTAAVNYHIEYLVERLGLKGYGELEDRRAALIGRALWFGIVREEHLALLTPVDTL
ncbi:hypothetical protein [Nocardia sp. NPDC058480]